MKRSFHTAIAFGLCLALVLGAMGWVSLTALRLDRAEAEARRQGAIEENVRLALWRMDSALAPLIARENARPYFNYSSFYPAGRAYTRMFAQIRPGEVLIPSPILTEVSPYILLHFQFAPDGELTSPKVPTGNMRDIAEAGHMTQGEIETAARLLAALRGAVNADSLMSLLPAERSLAGLPGQMESVQQQYDISQNLPQMAQRQESLNVMEWQARTQTYQQATSKDQAASNLAEASSDVTGSVMTPLWVGGALLLVRHVTVNGQDYLQGCSLDWPAMREWLLGGIRDLLPQAALAPLTSETNNGQERRLAALPVRLVPGPVPLVETGGRISPIRLAVLISWGCVLLAATAVAVLLFGAVSLSERRGTFVSAVTHELRTPLTTFRMYTEMLAEKMVPDEGKRRHYLETLRLEAQRLSHLVENVLAYARLERNRAASGLEGVTVRELIDRALGRLSERAQQSGMMLVAEETGQAAWAVARVDSSAVEQILFNLVDNACKYASSSSDRRIHLQVGRAGKYAAIRVCDHGSGIAKKDAGRIFRPFCKSAREAASSGPGVGLGLALSRRLARSMGGDLRLDEDVKDGACFVLTLPVRK